MSARNYRRSIMGPLFLVGLGVLVLLHNLGILTWSFWEAALHLWPLVLVAWGLDLLLGRRSAWGAAIAIILILVLLVGGISLLDDARQGPESLMDIEIPLGETQAAQITIDPALVYLRLRSADQTGQVLLGGRVVPFYGERVEQDIERSGANLEAAIRTAGIVVMPFFRASTDRPSWDMELHPGVVYDLVVDVGGGKADLFLEDLLVETLTVDQGIGQTIVYLPKDGSYTAEIDAGLGQVVVHLTDTLGVKLYADVGLGAVDVPNNFRREGDAYLSPNYSQAEERVEINVSLGIGSVEIR
jgi:hypothetical protein